MKLKYIISILCIVLFTLSCSTDDDTNSILNEVEDLIKIQDINNNTHTIEFFNKTGKFETGYNAISLRIKDNTTDTYVENASLNWIPVMQMPTTAHSSPKSEISKTIGMKTVYEGFIVYQMANLDGSGWSLSIDYTIDGNTYNASSDIVVMQSEFQNVTSFTGADEKRYVLVLRAPEEPKIAINRLKVGLFTMETMMSFPVVEAFRMTLDPRMPGMGNHSSPNNTDLTYNSAKQLYEGNLSLTMTGYWVLNLQLLNAAGELLKGEPITEDHPKSSLYLELEF